MSSVLCLVYRAYSVKRKPPTIDTSDDCALQRTMFEQMEKRLMTGCRRLSLRHVRHVSTAEPHPWNVVRIERSSSYILNYPYMFKTLINHIDRFIRTPFTRPFSGAAKRMALLRPTRVLSTRKYKWLG